MDWVSNFQIYQNTFETSWFALNVGSGVDSTVRIHHNSFHRMYTVLFIGVTDSRPRPSNPMFNYNCMTVVDRYYAWFTACGPYPYNNILDIHAENNYWNGVQSPQAIHNSLVWDCVRQPPAPAPCPCFILEPEILSSCGQIMTLTDTLAGICED
jgi:hypothetical protein